MPKRLLLLGGGHSHVHVLKTLTERYLPEAEVTLISPYARQVYSGMLPGWVAGHYAIDQCVIPLAPLAQRADVTFLQKAARRIDFATQTVLCDDGTAVPFDVLSIDTGPVADLSALPGAENCAVSIRPIEKFIEAFAGIKASIDAGATRRIAFVGAGAGGIELAMAMEFAFRRHGVGVTLISAADTLPGSAGKRLARLLRARGISLLSGHSAARIGPHEVHLASGSVVAADHIIVATGAVAAAWPRAAGLACDEQGFITVNAQLQSVSHPAVFAAGDCASMENAPRPRSGVYAVRAGPPLADNLRRFCKGEPLLPYHPQPRSLYLISAGDRYAVGSWGNLSWEGHLSWWWKDRIDRRFIAKYAAN
ncbi:MAG: FAD-dependent oxidoreductase [Betaproteobacteria bacterium]|nr:FAD-dependent oxidoreductase [Betaproteobacteria bacterium]